MRGFLSDLAFIEILELVHLTRQTGVLEVQAELPFTVTFSGGEIVSGGILDWLGPEALAACPILPQQGRFEFIAKPIEGRPLGPYRQVVTEWARQNDEWEAICSVIGSPSQIYQGAYPLFDDATGRSVRAAARKSERPIFELARSLASAVQAGVVEPLNRYAWFGLLLPPDQSGDPEHPVAQALNGERNLGAVVKAGYSVQQVRDYLYTSLRQGLRFPGSGWVLRDLMWEMKYA